MFCVLEKPKFQFVCYVLFCIERTIILKGNKKAVGITRCLRFVSKRIKKQKTPSSTCSEFVLHVYSLVANQETSGIIKDLFT